MTKHGAVQWYDSEGASSGYGPVTFDPALEYYAKNYLGISVLQIIVVMFVLVGFGLFVFGCIFGYLVGKCLNGPKRESQEIPEPGPEPEFEPRPSAAEPARSVDPPRAESPEPSAPPPPPPPEPDERHERHQPRAPPPPPPTSVPEPERTWRGTFGGIYCSVPGKLYKTEKGDHFHLSEACGSGYRKACTPVKGYDVCLHCMRAHGFSLFQPPTGESAVPGYGRSQGSGSRSTRRSQ